MEIVAAESRPREVRYVVRNEGDAPIWVVDDGWLAWRQDGRQIELGFQRAPMQPGVEPFGYFGPQVVGARARRRAERAVALSLAAAARPHLERGGQGRAGPGEYEVAVRVGYGETPEPPPAGRSGRRSRRRCSPGSARRSARRCR